MVTKEQLASLERQFANIGILGSRDVNAIRVEVCDECKEIGQNSSSTCQMYMEDNKEEVKQVNGNMKYDMISNTFHRALRNHYHLRVDG